MDGNIHSGDGKAQKVPKRRAEHGVASGVGSMVHVACGEGWERQGDGARKAVAKEKIAYPFVG